MEELTPKQRLLNMQTFVDETLGYITNLTEGVKTMSIGHELCYSQISPNFKGQTNAKAMYKGNTNIQYVPPMDWSKVTDAQQAFQECSNLNEVMGDIIAPQCDLRDCFSGVSFRHLEDKIVKAKTIGGCFNVNPNLELIENMIFEIGNGDVAIGWVFYGCSNLKVVRNVKFSTTHTSNSEGLYNTFQNCTNLEIVEGLEVVGGSHNYFDLFHGCTNLKSFNPLTCSSIFNQYGFHDMVTDCVSLTDEGLDNLLLTHLNCNISRIASRDRNLYYAGLRSSNYPRDRIEALPHYSDFISAGWSIGY